MWSGGVAAREKTKPHRQAARWLPVACVRTVDVVSFLGVRVCVVWGGVRMPAIR